MGIRRTALLSSGASIASRTSNEFYLGDSNGVAVTLDITGTPNNAETLSLSIDTKDPTSGKWAVLYNFNALTASVLGAAPTTATYIIVLVPGAERTTQATTAGYYGANVSMTDSIRVRTVHSAGGSWTYAVTAQSLPT